MAPNVKIGNTKWVIFCKKNGKDLEKLVSKIGGMPGKVIIDDEPDHAGYLGTYTRRSHRH
jgi:hypothetical protein